MPGEVEEIEKQILQKMDGYNTKLDETIKRFDDFDKDAKKSVEDFQKARDEYQGTSNQLTAAVASLRKMVAIIQRQGGEMHGDPIQRIAGNEEKRARLNAAVRSVFRGKFDRQAAEIAKALGEDSSPGSTLINDELSRDIYDTLTQWGMGWQQLDVEDMGTKVEKLPIDTADPVAQWVLTEGGSLSDDANITGSQVSLTAEVVAVLLYVSIQLLEDAEYDLTNRILRKFRNAFNYRMNHGAFIADGTADATHGGMTGLFEFGTAKVAASGNTTVEATDLEDWTGTMLTPDVEVLNRAPRWWIHPHMLIRAISVKDSNGRPIFLTANEAPTPGGIGSILGAPVSLIPAAPSTNSASGKVAVFGDGQGFAVGVRRDFQFAESTDHKFANLQDAFRAHGRAAMKGKRASAFGVLTLAAS